MPRAQFFGLELLGSYFQKEKGLSECKIDAPSPMRSCFMGFTWHRLGGENTN